MVYNIIKYNCIKEPRPARDAVLMILFSFTLTHIYNSISAFDVRLLKRNSSFDMKLVGVKTFLFMKANMKSSNPSEYSYSIYNPHHIDTFAKNTDIFQRRFRANIIAHTYMSKRLLKYFCFIIQYMPHKPIHSIQIHYKER